VKCFLRIKKKRRTFYTSRVRQKMHVIVFKDTAAGRIAHRVWQSMSCEQKKETGLLDRLKQGCRVMLPPGMDIRSFDSKRVYI
jgi:hypothetical protein